jgi:16S rRNA A1518/A1519 N6-dimethyltransferase RsmA/KsgA/DIM1 with predicted DNA glycosylase/AP lyase activity
MTLSDKKRLKLKVQSIHFNTLFFKYFCILVFKEWDGLVRIAFVRKNKTLNACFKYELKT